MTNNVDVCPELIRDLAEELGTQKLVELVCTISAYNGCSRFLAALDISIAGETPPGR